MSNTATWNTTQKILFRVVIIYFLLQALPLDWKFYQTLFSSDLLHLRYEAIFNLANYTTRFGSGPATFVDWGILFVISIAGAVSWNALAEKKGEVDYEKAFYWLRTILRYRLALALLAYGFLKLFVLQSPYPSLSSLNTPYGSFNRWKLFSLSLGIVPSYELFLGLVELILAGLLLYRRTASIAAFIFLIFCGNIFVSNIAYDGGELVYSLLLITFAFVIFSVDLQRTAVLLFLQKPAAASTFHPVFSRQTLRLVLKSTFVLFFVLVYGISIGNSAKHDSYQYPTQKGLKDAKGLYNISTFIVNRDTIPYSLTDSIRWRNVVFEEWNTLSILTNIPAPLDSNNEHIVTAKTDNRLYEIEGTNGRHYYSYTIDESEAVLHLQNRFPGAAADKFTLHYTRPDASTILLSGITPAKDTISIVLNKIDKKYLLEEASGKSRNRKIKL